MVYFPVEIFSNILSFLDNSKTNHKKKQIKLNYQLNKLATDLTYDDLDWKLLLLSPSFNNNNIIKLFDDRYILSDDDDDDEYDEEFFEEAE